MLDGRSAEEILAACPGRTVAESGQDPSSDDAVACRALSRRALPREVGVDERKPEMAVGLLVRRRQDLP